MSPLDKIVRAADAEGSGGGDNQWDSLSSYFDTSKAENEIPAGAADNVLIAWPALLKGIQQVQRTGEGLHALDFGCGGGGFLMRLKELGYDVVGCDNSPAMVQTARKNVGEAVPVHVADVDHLQDLPNKPFDLVSAVMVLQFIENISEALAKMNSIVKGGGVLSFAVFNPAYIKNNHGKGKLFVGFPDAAAPHTGYIQLDDQRIPVFIRSQEEYDAMLVSLGYHRIASESPPFTSEFLKKYPQDTDTSASEYLVLTYQKTT